MRCHNLPVDKMIQGRKLDESSLQLACHPVSLVGLAYFLAPLLLALANHQQLVCQFLLIILQPLLGAVQVN
jgi:hypothetical protein